MKTEHRNLTHLLTPQHIDNLRAERYLTLLHSYFNTALNRVQAAAGVPICIEGCGKCCSHNSVLSYGVEAELAVGWLYSHPDMILDLKAKCRAWLIEPGDWTYTRQMSPELWASLEPEYLRALVTRCPFLQDDARCSIHEIRPIVCRAYGVTRLPGVECPRPLGIGETDGQKITFNPNNSSLPIKPLTEEMIAVTQDARYTRWGFFYTMLYERLDANDLAGLIDDGRVPAVKGIVLQGNARMMLWQTQLDEEWQAIEADKSIATQSYLKPGKGGTPVLKFHVDRRGKVSR